MDVPIDDEPELYFWLHSFVNAFSLLSSSRPPSFSGVAPIPVSEILAYCLLNDIYDKEEFLLYIKSMDSIFIKFYNDKSKEKQKQPQTKQKTGRR